MQQSIKGRKELRGNRPPLTMQSESSGLLMTYTCSVYSNKHRDTENRRLDERSEIPGPSPILEHHPWKNLFHPLTLNFLIFPTKKTKGKRAHFCKNTTPLLLRMSVTTANWTQSAGTLWAAEHECQCWCPRRELPVSSWATGRCTHALPAADPLSPSFRTAKLTELNPPGWLAQQLHSPFLSQTGKELRKQFPGSVSVDQLSRLPPGTHSMS